MTKLRRSKIKYGKINKKMKTKEKEIRNTEIMLR
jgi:hypothetical protein